LHATTAILSSSDGDTNPSSAGVDFMAESTDDVDGCTDSFGSGGEIPEAVCSPDADVIVVENGPRKTDDFVFPAHGLDGALWSLGLRAIER
jgi:hypothetical protein